jgi:hypothetical protein
MFALFIIYAETTLNVPQFNDFYKCSSGSRIRGSQFFARLTETYLIVKKKDFHNLG